VVPLGGRGQVSIYTQSGGHVLADVFGYSAAARSSDGLFVPWTPPRVLNTRFKLRWMRCLHGAANR